MQRIRLIQEIQRKKYMPLTFAIVIRRMLYHYIRKVRQVNVKIQVHVGFLSWLFIKIGDCQVEYLFAGIVA